MFIYMLDGLMAIFFVFFLVITYVKIAIKNVFNFFFCIPTISLSFFFLNRHISFQYPLPFIYILMLRGLYLLV